MLLLLFVSSCPAADAPAIFQSTPNFSNAIAGSGFDVTWTAAPLVLTTDDTLTLTIRFVGVANPDRVRRPDLASRPNFKANFREILNGADEPPDKSSVSFIYHLRTRNDSIRGIPELEVTSFSPGNGKLTKYLDAIPLSFGPTASLPPAVRPLEAPERFFALPDSNRATALPPSRTAWIGLFAVLLAAPPIGIFSWRYRNPDGMRFAKIRRNRSVRAALDGLERAGRSPEPVAAAVKVFHDYLASRFGAVAPTPTPGDIARAMAEVQLPTDRIEEALQLVRDCDAARFSGGTERGAVSIPRVRRLILAWEEQP